MWRSRMFWRLFGVFSILLLGAIGVLGVIIVQRVERHNLDQIEDSLRTKAILVREVFRDRLPDTDRAFQQQVGALRKGIETRITLIDTTGRVLADTEEDPDVMDNHAERPEVRTAVTHRFGVASRFSHTTGEDMMYVALRTDAERGPVAFVRVALSLARINEQLAVLRGLVWTAAAVTGVAALGLAFWLSRRIARPLQELTTGAERIGAGEFGHKVLAEGRDEVGLLARTFNSMSEQLASQFTQLAEDRQQLRTILSGMVEGVVALDIEERILFANERAAELLEFEPQTTPGRKLWEVVRRRSLLEVVRRALAGPEPYREEINWNGPTARSVTVHAARLAGPTPRGAVLVLHDTSELRRLERLRQEFVANVSHELKTPLASIKAGVETLLAGAVEDVENRGRFLGTIADQADRLHALILDLLSLNRIESGTEAFVFDAVPLRPLVTACLERHAARAAANNQQLQTDAPEVELSAWADAEAVDQILDNLVDNALKYTPPGGTITVSCRAENEQVCLEVKDTGIGIPAQDLPRIFERFYRVDKARSRELGGTGLGLSIVKHLVQAMHGSIHANSEPGRGSSFVVRLPCAADS